MTLASVIIYTLKTSQENPANTRTKRKFGPFSVAPRPKSRFATFAVPRATQPQTLHSMLALCLRF
jgi:hypothetical protein